MSDFNLSALDAQPYYTALLKEAWSSTSVVQAMPLGVELRTACQGSLSDTYAIWLTSIKMLAA